MTKEEFFTLLNNNTVIIEKDVRSLMFAIALTESSLEPSATRYEPDWMYFSQAPAVSKRLGITEETERIHQSTSWGLMQLMGTVARQLGYMSHLPRLIYPELNLVYGYKHVVNLIKKFPDRLDVISAYNLGFPKKQKDLYVNQQYVNTVLRHMAQVDASSS